MKEKPQMKKFGLIGFPLSHSFSKKYFSEKFEKEKISDCQYDLYELPDIDLFPDLIKSNPDLKGLNVTIPHKEKVKPFLSSLDESALKVGAVNVIKVNEGVLTGYNSDYYGFKTSLEKWLPDYNKHAMVLGTGGAAKAVKAVLDSLNIPFIVVSRNKSSEVINYEEANEMLNDHNLIINTTPLGMNPNIHTCPPLDYEKISKDHFLYDLVYNPEITLFMKKGEEKGAKVKNGLEMLYLQAEKSWEIWNNKQ